MTRTRFRPGPLAALLVLLTGGVGAAPAVWPAAPAAPEPNVTRVLVPWLGDRWIGDAIAYGPHRDGQSPDGAQPTTAELRDDLHLMARHWNLLRLYGSTGPAERILQIIRDDSLNLKVMLGIWIAPEERRDQAGRVIEPLPAGRESNRREVEAGIRLAREYPEAVAALCVGNETQVFWSAHRLPAETLIGHVRRVRGSSTAPVTVADDFNFWNKPESRAVAAEIDFVTLHAHPLWNGQTLDTALDWTRRTVHDIQLVHPGRTIVLGECGWATARGTTGDQGKLMKGVTDEATQAAFVRQLRAWIREERRVTFVFEAFDENWKGGPDATDVEKHWGLFRADRSPKPAMAEGE